MITFNDAKKVVLKAHSDSIITSAMQLKNGYLFALKPKDWGDKQILDPFFKVDFNGKLSEYSPVMDPDEFKYGLAHPIGVKQNE